jgi:hypothetical protein
VVEQDEVVQGPAVGDDDRVESIASCSFLGEM